MEDADRGEPEERHQRNLDQAGVGFRERLQEIENLKEVVRVLWLSEALPLLGFDHEDLPLEVLEEDHLCVPQHLGQAQEDQDDKQK